MNAQQNYGFYSTPVLKPGDNAAEKLANTVFYKIETAKNTVFTGEPFLVEYKLYMSVLEEPGPGKVPAFTGCSIVDLPPQQGPVIETVNGKAYNVLVVRKIQVTPLQDGELILPEASVNNIIQYVTTDKPYNVKSYSIAAYCQPVTITVKPLPEKDKPADFSGLVGNFTLTTKLDSNTIPQNDNTHLTLTIAGTGNIDAINVPAINWPRNTQHFDATDTQHTFSDTFPVSGAKIFSIPFIGTKQGNAVIPPVSFSYFDPAAEKYVTLHSDSLDIKFTGPLPKSEQREIVTEDITNRKYLWIVPAIALTVAFVLIITGKKQRNEKKKKEAAKAIQQLPAEVKPQPAAVVKPAINFYASLRVLGDTPDDKVFFNRAKELLTLAVQQKFNLTALNENGILAQLALTGADTIIQEHAGNIYRICNLRLYSPVTDDGQRLLVMETLTTVITELKV
ncbi:MAG TPA: BatD family protein [Chitinophagaceae bacterium]|nr:BatD family protein [Chitinophagaceae bacterium]